MSHPNEISRSGNTQTSLVQKQKTGGPHTGSWPSEELPDRMPRVSHVARQMTSLNLGLPDARAAREPR